MFSCFFFQAEDGIRDHCVTGVQTCALPICISSMSFTKGCTAAKKTLNSGLDRNRSEERRVGKSVDLGGRRIIKKKKKERHGHRVPRERLELGRPGSSHSWKAR